MPSVRSGRSGFFNCLQRPLVSTIVICQNAKITCGIRTLSESKYHGVRVKYSLIQVQGTGSSGESVLVRVDRICCFSLVLEVMQIAAPAGPRGSFLCFH